MSTTLPPSLLPVAHAPILAMSGGGAMDSLLPTAQAPIVAMSGGGAMDSLLPTAQAPIVAMSGGSRESYKAVMESFGIKDTFVADQEELRALPEDPTCVPLTNQKVFLCASLQPFVDRRIQALFSRVGFGESNEPFPMGCGTIERVGKELKISFHRHAITLLSGDLTGTFAAFRRDMTPHRPLPPATDHIDAVHGLQGLLSWMLGVSVTNTDTFDLVTFVKDMTQPLPLHGFRRFLSYHKEKIEDADVLKYAMELYGYETGPLSQTVTDRLYGWIFPSHTAVRYVNKEFYVYSSGKVTTVSTWKEAWPSHQKGFTVYEPSSSLTPIAPAVSSVPVESSAPAASSVPVESLAPAASSVPAASLEPAASSVPVESLVPATPVHETTSIVKKNTIPVTIPDQQEIGNHLYTLQGMIHHKGDMKGGHYTYLYHNHTSRQKKWIHFNDDQITYPTQRPNEDIDTGYIYVFEKDVHKIKGKKGITNVGNSCWMNAAIQMFYHLPEYRTYIETVDLSSLPTEIVECTRALQQIFLTYSEKGSISIECSKEYKTLFEYAFPGQSIGSQQDAMEFITKVLLHIMDHDPDLRSLFQINERSTLTCTTPESMQSSTSTPTTALLLTLPSGSSPTLQTLLDDYVKPNTMSGDTKVNGKDCNNPTQTMTLEVPTSNKYVIISLQRFANLV